MGGLPGGKVKMDKHSSGTCGYVELRVRRKRTGEVLGALDTRDERQATVLRGFWVEACWLGWTVLSGTCSRPLRTAGASRQLGVNSPHQVTKTYKGTETSWERSRVERGTLPVL